MDASGFVRRYCAAARAALSGKRQEKSTTDPLSTRFSDYARAVGGIDGVADRFIGQLEATGDADLVLDLV